MIGCNKVVFESKDIALKTMVQINNKKHLHLKSAYKCIYCKMWHLTSMNKNKSRKAAHWIKENGK